VEAFPLHLSGKGYKSPLGELSIWAPSATLVLARMTGFGEARFVEPILEHFDKASAGGARVHLFVDFEHLDNYESGLRTRGTAYFVQRRASIASLHMLARSRLVAMGVAVANLALDGIMTFHSTRGPFNAALDRELLALGVVGFSSAVVAA